MAENSPSGNGKSDRSHPMETISPSLPPRSPHEEVENGQQQPPISGSPPPASVRSPIEDVDSNSPYVSSPLQTSLRRPLENPADRQQNSPIQDVEGQQELPVPPLPPPHEELHDRQQPLLPPSPSVGSPPPSSFRPPSPPPTGPEHPPENVSPNHESLLRKQASSPSTPPTASEDPVESSNHHNPNLNSDHESPSPYSPPPQSSFESPSATILEENRSPKAHQSPKDPSPSPQSPPPTAASPSSPQETLEPNTDDTQQPPPPVGVPLLLHTMASASPSKPQTSPWTHQETANLIQAYQEKWYSLKKGPLKASQWEEVAITVAARCGYDEPTKSAKQCRHKIEKLRKRYRAERAKPRSRATAWNFFKLMDNLEKGPLPISSSQPMALIEHPKPNNLSGKKRKNNDSDGEFLVNKKSSRSKSFSHIANGGLTRNLRFSDGGSERFMRGLRTPMIHKDRGSYQQEEEEDSDYDEEEDGVAAQLAAEIKSFAERFIKMENKKIEMIRDAERCRMEMENKRMEMILESQQMLVDTVNKAFSSSHKTHKLSAN